MEDNRIETFSKLKKLFTKYEEKLIIKEDIPGRYALEGNTEYKVTSERTGKSSKRHNAYFGGLIIQSSYVGLYLMAPYMEANRFKRLEILMPTLKGKSCFHIKNLTPELIVEIEQALKLSYEIHKERGLVE